jgi:acyl-coenzyme A synthetase/AMP-(fatty) acid ligase
VSPARVAAALLRHPGVVDAAIVPVAAASGLALGILVETADRSIVSALRQHLARSLPSWCQPRVIATTPGLPRQPGGRADRRACIEILERSLEGLDESRERGAADV